MLLLLKTKTPNDRIWNGMVYLSSKANSKTKTPANGGIGCIESNQCSSLIINHKLDEDN